MRIIPAIDLRQGQCVRLIQGDFTRQITYDNNPVAMARHWQNQGASLIHVVDLDGAKEGSSANPSVIEAICQSTSCLIELGGGLRTMSDIERALSLGVHRVVIGTGLIQDPAWGGTLIAQFGAEKIVAGIDGRQGKVATHGWQMAGEKSIVEMVIELERHGVRHFIVTDIATDGMLTGPNLALISAVCDHAPQAGIIASGGIGNGDHIKALVKLSKHNLAGVIVGKALYDERVTYRELAELVDG